MGDACLFAHGEAELRVVRDPGVVSSRAAAERAASPGAVRLTLRVSAGGRVQAGMQLTCRRQTHASSPARTVAAMRASAGPARAV